MISALHGHFGTTGRTSRIAVALVPAAIVVIVQLVIFPMPAGTWLQGVVLGLLNSLVALGLTLIWRSNRVLNFAQADMGTFPAALGVGLILLSGANYLVGFVVGLAAAVVVGLLIELIVIRRFRHSPRLTLTVATIGISQFLIVGALLAPRLWGETLLSRRGSNSYTFPIHHTFSVGQQLFHADDIVAAFVAISCLIAVSLFLKHSDTGLAVRAAAERADRASLLGIPVQRMEAVTWVIASVLSFLGVFLQGAILGFPLTATVGIAALVTALAALTLGGFDNLFAILASAVALGVLLQGVRWHNTSHPTVVFGVLGLVILGAMLIRRRGRSRAERDPVSSWLAALEPRPLPRNLRARPLSLIGGVVAVIAAALIPLSMSVAQQYQLGTLVAIAIIALSIVVLTGWAGQITLGQMGFAALGASLGAAATVTWRLDVVLGLLICTAAGAIAGVIVGLPSLRFRGLLPAATTLAFALAASGYLFDPNQFGWIPTGPVIPQRALGLWNIDTPLGMYEACLVVAVICIIGVVGIRNSQLGRSIRSSRDNELASQSYSVSQGRAQLSAFAISGSLASIGGFLLVLVAQHFDAATYAPQESLNIFTAAVVGGVGSILGVLLGAFYLNGSRWLLDGYWQLLPTAIGVLVVLIVFPGGLSSVLYRVRDSWARRRAQRLGVPFLGPATGPATAETVSNETHSQQLGDAPGDVLLDARGIKVAYAGVDILFGVDLIVRRGETVALLGTNGAGKSTLLRALCGITPLKEGSVYFDGDDLKDRGAEEIATLGIAQMPGGQGVFETLTVAENLRVAGWLLRHDRSSLLERIDEQLSTFTVLADRRQEPAANLSGGQQQMLALSMAMLGQPQLLLIDELSLGLSPIALESLLVVLGELREAGTTMIIVEQSANVAMGLADRACFMERGAIRFEGPTAELLDRPDLLRSVYLSNAGEGVASRVQRRGSATMNQEIPESNNGTVQPVLAVREVTAGFGMHTILRGVSLDVQPREIVGIIGPNGAGKTTLFDVISGFTPLREGTVHLLGREVTSARPPLRFRQGLGRSFQDSRLFPSLTVTEAVEVACSRWLSLPDPVSAGLRLPVRQISERAAHVRAAELIEIMGLGNLRFHLVGELSTGQRRLVDLASVLAHEPRVVLLDEPSSGVAQHEAAELVPVITGIRDATRAAIVVIEHDMSIVTSLVDRLVALDQGETLATGDPGEVLTNPLVVASYLGDPSNPKYSTSSAQGAPTQ